MQFTDVKTSRPDGALDLALSRLRQMIASGTLLPGEQIRQQEVAELIGVSRVPLREALNVLATQGLLIHRRNQGYFVAKRLPMELAQIRRMLQLLENELMLSLVWPDEEVVKELQSLNRQMEQHVKSPDLTPFLTLNRQFHFVIFDLSPYKLIVNQVARLWDLAEPFIANKLVLLESRQRTCEEHAVLIEALRRQNLGECITNLDNHRSSSMPGPTFDGAIQRQGKY